jgi:ATP-dependent helicase HrpB
MTTPQIPDAGLPVEAAVPAVRHALAEQGHAVLTAPPGSGKTTVVPLRLLGSDWLEGRKIVLLEPRRLATRAAARRMAHLLGEDVGRTVGYVTRTDRNTGPGVRVEVVTEGVLTRRLQRDPGLMDTGLVVFDEFHERNLQTDLGLALALDARAVLRPDLRILVMSATIDAARVAALVGGDEAAPVVAAEARTHPVELRWAPPPRNARLEPHAAAVIRKVLDAEPGDVLVFLPGMGEMRRIAGLLAEDGISADVRLLHGSLPLAEQDAAISPSLPGRRKVVLSTDIAETSLTVEGVRIVVDSGLARAPRFDARTGMTRLRTVSISKASADQRAGRAGRTEPGVAFRLWSKLEQGGRTAHIVPEITQVDLAGFALELATWGASRPDHLRFLDPPPPRTFEEARSLLALLGALDAGGRLTGMGRAMAGLPLHPRLAHMVVAAEDEDTALACVVAALVDDRDILRGRPEEVPVDLAERVAIVAGDRRHPLADRAAVERVRRNARDLADRAGAGWGAVEPGHAGRIAAAAYPDRLAIRRGSPGRFQLRTGTTAWFAATDPLAVAPFLVVCDIDGKRKDARIRLAAALTPDEVAAGFARDVDERRQLAWDGDRLVERIERRLGGFALDRRERRPEPGPDTTAAIVDRIRERGLAVLAWSGEVEELARRVAFLHVRLGDPWPDWSAETLLSSLDVWLLPHAGMPTGLDDFAGLDLRKILMRSLDPRAVAELDQLAPPRITVPSGRALAVDYTGDVPVLAVRVQEMFGSTSTPEVAGEPVRLHLLSPAGRPVQITRDLAGFWEGSWADVRKDMAGRYPKHPWPEDPAHAEPTRR